MPIVEVKNLSKRYVLGETQRYLALRDTVSFILQSPLKWFKSKIGENSNDSGFWALKDVNFSMERGEVLGIIGRNGAGKSTLLKVLSRITPPTTGEIKICGKVGSLLEVGTGFHPELTGRENIFLNGAILGMTKKDIKKNFDAIVEFSGVEKFLDTPVKRYSSGMHVRLAFAVAAYLEPEILLVDEVLAVGDAEFQKKCLGKMEEVTRKDGRTIIFVSHNMGAITNLCPRTIWLENGQVKMDGPSQEVVSAYLSENKQFSGQVIWDDPRRMPGDGELVKFMSVKAVKKNGSVSNLFFVEESIIIELEYEILKPARNIQLGFKLIAQDGEVVFYSGDHNFVLEPSYERGPGKYLSRCEIPANLLNQGQYFLSLTGHIPGVKFLVNAEQVIEFNVEQQTNISGPGIQPGLLRPILKWDIEKK